MSAAPAISLWRTPRSRSLLLISALSLLAACVAFLAREYTELLWFQEVGQQRVFWTTQKWRILGYGVPAVGTAAFLLVNFAGVERVLRGVPARRPQRRLAYPVAAVAAGVFSAGWGADGGWQRLALWAGRSDFGERDPVFHRDAGFFVFSLPLYEQVAGWLLATLAMAGVATLAAYAVAGGLRLARPRMIVRGARAHLLRLAALALLVVAWRYRLDQFALALPHKGSALPGAGHTDVHVRLPALQALALLSACGAALSLYAARRRVPRSAVAVVASLFAVALAVESVVPPLVERLDVQPQELSRELPYLSSAIAATRRAFALDDVDVRELPAAAQLSTQGIAENQRTLDNVPLWDADVLDPALDELQGIGRYYGFRSSTLGVYASAGSPQLVAIAARQLDRTRLVPDGQSWANDRFAYTHGYGAVAVRAGAADADGHPRFTAEGFRPAKGPLGVHEPRIYFGEQPGRDPPYVVARTRRGEVDVPRAGSAPPDYHYDGPGGIPVSSLLRRTAFAARFGDVRLLLTETLGDDARLLLHRGARERLVALAPFLDWDRNPQTAVIDGRVQFLYHGYTSSTDYPYAQRIRFGTGRANYIRASAQAVVDSFSGRVSIYATDPEDPILRAWRAAYPTLFLPASRMPAGLRAQLRYPRRLFTAQARAYETYHADDPVAFWNGTDAWQRPEQLAGPVEQAGNIRFPEPDDPRTRPDYLFAKVPGLATERLLLVTPFGPRGRQNLAAYLAGTIDARGRPRLTLLSLPRDRSTLGPTQATRRILASPAVNRRLELLNRESADLGKAAVNRTILGAARTVPVGQALVHVQPVYVVSGGSGLPELQLVTVYVDGHVGFGRDVATALRRAVGGTNPTGGAQARP